MDEKRFRKKALALAAATVTTVSALSLGMAGTANAATFPLGDVNLDGKVNLKDAQMALKGALCIVKLDDMQFRAADVNKDNKVDLRDAQKILKGALMIEKIEGEISDTPPTTPPIETEKPIEPTETAVPTTAPTIQPTEVKTTLENGTVVITTPDEGIEGVDWEWRTTYTWVHYCSQCGKCILVNDHGYLQNYKDHFDNDPDIAILEEYMNSAEVIDPDVVDELLQSICIGNFISKMETLTYKVRLK